MRFESNKKIIMRLYTRKINPKGTITISTSSSEDKYFEEIDSKKCCKCPKITEEDGYRVCQNCGFIFSQVYDDTPRRSYTREEKNNRIINEIVYTPIGPRTIINGNKDAYGRLINSQYHNFYRKLSKINKSIFSSYERNFYIAFPVFERIKERLSLPDNLMKDALKIYRFSVEKRMTLGRSIESLISASIYCIIRIHGIPITMEEVIEISNVPKKKCVKDFNLIKTKILPFMNFKVKVKHLTPEKYILRFSQDLKLSMKCSNTALKMLEQATKNGYNISGRDPKGIAAALLYNASQLHGEIRSQKEISEKSQVTQVTLRNRRKELFKC